MTSAEQKMPSVWLLGVASGLSPFGMSIVVPSLDSISRHFSADFLSVQFVISAYLLGLALAQPACGFLCDRYGRRPVMLTGFVVFIVASVLCALAQSLDLLIVGRFVQAAGVSVGTVASRAVLRDTRSGNDVAVGMSYIAALMGVAPVIAPIAGGLLDTHVGYTWIFLISAAIGVMVLVNMVLRMTETLDRQRPQPRWRDWLANYRVLLASRKFMGNTMVFGFVQGAFFAFMAVGASYFASEFQVNSSSFGTIWGLLAIAYVGGAWLGASATKIVGSHRVVAAGSILGLAAGLALAGGALLGPMTIPKIMLPLGFLMVVSGATTPSAMAGAIESHPAIAGTASGLSSSLGLTLGGCFTVLAGALYNGQFLPMALLILGAVCATAVSCMIAQS